MHCILHPTANGSKAPIPYDQGSYGKCHKIENSFARLKDWPRIATRFDRCTKFFLSAFALAAIVMFLPCALTLV